MDSTSDHEFNPASASPALKQAIQQLAEVSSRPMSDFINIRMGDAYELAVETYGDDLPEFWVVWNSWNTASDDHAPWGDLE